MTIRLHVPVDIIGVFYFRFWNRKSQSQQKLAKKITHFTIQFAQKTSLILRNSNHSTLRKICSTTSQKTFLTLQIFQQTCFWLVSEKTFGLHFESKCLYISLYLCKNIFVPETWEAFIWWSNGGRLNHFHKAVHCLCFVKYFKIFHSNLNFWKLNCFSAFRYFHL